MEIRQLNESMVNEFLDVLETKNYRQNTITNYRSTYNQLLEYFDNEIMLHDLTKADIYNYFSWLEFAKNYTDRTFNFKISAIKSLFEYMVLIRAREDIPITNLMYRKLDRKEPKVLSKNEQKLWINHLEEKARGDQALASKIQLASGLRIEEVLNLDLYKDLEIRDTKGYIHVRQAKGRKGRICPIFNDNLTLELKEFKKLYFKAESYKLYLHREPYQHHTRTFLEKHNIYITSHMLRATFATERYEEGMDLNTIRILLGHKSINTTLLYLAYRADIYSLIA